MFCSVIIPMYNKALFVETAINSVLRQSHTDFEIIVIDDGSHDHGANLVKGFTDERIQLVQQPNGGVSRARNRGIALAKGELICFLDADDWYEANYLETIVSLATTHPEIGLFASSFRRVPLKSGFPIPSQALDSSRTIEVIDDLYDRWRRQGAFFCTDSVAVRRPLLHSLQPGFPAGESLGEDQDVWFRLSEKSSMAYCNAQLVGYRIDVEGSLCATNEVLFLLPVYERLEQRALSCQLPERLRRSALRLVTEMRITLARTYLMRSRRFEAGTQLHRAWRGIVSRRWWVSLAMCFLANPKIIRYWEESRVRTRN